VTVGALGHRHPGGLPWARRKRRWSTCRERAGRRASGPSRSLRLPRVCEWAEWHRRSRFQRRYTETASSVCWIAPAEGPPVRRRRDLYQASLKSPSKVAPILRKKTGRPRCLHEMGTSRVTASPPPIRRRPGKKVDVGWTASDPPGSSTGASAGCGPLAGLPL
jgi:hypothetical protein